MLVGTKFETCHLRIRWGHLPMLEENTRVRLVIPSLIQWFGEFWTPLGGGEIELVLSPHTVNCGQKPPEREGPTLIEDIVPMPRKEDQPPVGHDMHAYRPPPPMDPAEVLSTPCRVQDRRN